MRYEEQDCSIFMVNSKRTRYGASNITGEGRRGYFMPPFLLDRGVMLGNTLEVVLRMVNDLGGKRNDQIYCITGNCIWNGGINLVFLEHNLITLVYYYLDLVGGWWNTWEIFLRGTGGHLGLSPIGL